MKTGTYNVCDVGFYDTGGPSSAYGNSQNSTVTYCSASSQKLKVDFSGFDTETNGLIGRNEIIYDYLDIYDGADIYAPQMYHFRNNFV